MRAKTGILLVIFSQTDSEFDSCDLRRHFTGRAAPILPSAACRVAAPLGGQCQEGEGTTKRKPHEKAVIAAKQGRACSPAPPDRSAPI